jgi:chemotaxis protein histidine kinase CheA
MAQTQEGQLVELDPVVIDADAKYNTRFGLRPARIKDLANEISEAGGVMEPIEVSPLDKAVNGHMYRLTFGNYRLAAVKLLNEGGAKLKIPAIVRQTAEGKDARLRNLMENLGRQDMTLMDTAYAIEALTKEGVDKVKIREMFARPGRKGPASNSWVNITLGFLDLPKSIQNKLHNGELTWDGGAALVKVKRDHPDKLQDVLETLEKDREREIEREKRDEERYLASIKKADDLAAKEREQEEKLLKAQQDREEKLRTAKAAVEVTEKENAKLVAEAEKALKEATNAVSATPGAEAAKKVAEAAKKLESVKAQTTKAAERQAEALKKLQDKYAAQDKAEAEEAKAEAKEAADTKKAAAEAKEAMKQKGGTAKKKAAERPTTSADVKKAAKSAGASTGAVPLKRPEIMKVVDELCLPAGQGKAEQRVQSIGKALKLCFDGVTTTNALVKELMGICK